ncbi:MAG TPA: NUDIX domain-containing protein [Chitinophagaceae bacterium]|nr:NUDIX domain-containing protein [Chitinophagaceae bacterium]
MSDRQKEHTKNINVHTLEVDQYPKVTLSVDCVIFGIEQEHLKVMLIRSDIAEFRKQWTLLGDLVHEKESLDEAAKRVLQTRTGLSDVFLEQVHTFGEINRHPSGRVVSTAYYALVNMTKCNLNNYEHELHWHAIEDIKELAFDHNKILNICVDRLREAVQNRYVAFKLLPPVFSLRQLQDIHEAVLGKRLDRRNFRKKIISLDFIEDTGKIESDVSHRPGKLYKLKSSS